MKEVIASLMIWISSVTGLPVPEHQPALERVSKETLHAIQHPGKPYKPDQMPWEYVAIYEAQASKHGTIYVTPAWDSSSKVDISTLTHELVHHMQTHSNRYYRCIGNEEKQAYNVQIAQLRKFGYTNPLEAINLTPMALAFFTQCRPKR